MFRTFARATADGVLSHRIMEEHMHGSGVEWAITTTWFPLMLVLGLLSSVLIPYCAYLYYPLGKFFGICALIGFFGCAVCSIWSVVYLTHRTDFLADVYELSAVLEEKTDDLDTTELYAKAVNLLTSYEMISTQLMLTKELKGANQTFLSDALADLQKRRKRARAIFSKFSLSRAEEDCHPKAKEYLPNFSRMLYEKVCRQVGVPIARE